MYLATILTPRSLPEIGRAFGGRDHTTVAHARNTIERLMVEDPVLRRTVGELRSSMPREARAFPEADLDREARRARSDVARTVKAHGDADLFGRPADLRMALGDACGERVVSRATGVNGEQVELLMSSAGSWSLIAVSKDGTRARLVSHGRNWTEIARKPASTAPHAPARHDKIHLCLKCHERPVEGAYPGLCENCRDTNKGVSSLAEGVVG